MRAGPRSDRKGIGAYASTPVLSWTWGASLLAPAATGADCGNPQPGCTPTKFSSNPRTSPAYPHVRGSRNGALLFKVVADNVAKRNIAVVCDAAARRLLAEPGSEVRGVEVMQ